MCLSMDNVFAAGGRFDYLISTLRSPVAPKVLSLSLPSSDSLTFFSQSLSLSFVCLHRIKSVQFSDLTLQQKSIGAVGVNFALEKIIGRYIRILVLFLFLSYLFGVPVRTSRLWKNWKWAIFQKRKKVWKVQMREYRER